LCLEKSIDKKMKSFKNINVSSDGSLYFCYNSETVSNSKLVVFQKQDDKNFNFNQKKVKNSVESKHSSYYKKKYLK
jgi:hypothetical protein